MSEKASKKKRRKAVIDNTKNPALPQLKLILLQPKPRRRKRKLKMSPRSPTIIATRKPILGPIVSNLPSQKTSCNLGNFHIGNCKSKD